MHETPRHAETLGGGPDAAARRVLELVSARAPRLSGGHLVCVDGPAGSGKTMLAERLRTEVPGSAVVHMDDLYEGWGGLPTVDRQLTGLLRPLAHGRPGAYRRWDWHADAWAEQVTVDPAPLLVVEGVGSGSPTVAELVTVLVWVEAPHDQRLRRGLDRDGEAFAPHWERWAEAEQRVFDAHRTRERADLVVDAADRG
ncbi:uridine kinase family protein [Nocardioides coralli]|uniref:uridine kinase family protein n=1 Tax=Nocardioides coralli TaxID=2872154 RepID=UPI0020176C76|nr:ATP-binding protein [Nocardioides coralli]